jgi:molybdopterin-binding protein
MYYLCYSRSVRRDYYSASEAARALGISLDTLRRWDRQDRIRVERDEGNRRIVPAAEIERLRGAEARDELSARNRFRGVVRSVEVEGFLAQVEIDVTEPARVVAIITRESAEELGLKPGMSAAGIVKSTSVMVER